jgi:hypothetical protein
MEIRRTTMKEEMYLGIRIIEIISIAVFIFGSLWTGTDILQLTFPQFMMLYGAIGAAVSEIIARILHRQIKKNDLKGGTLHL